MPQFDYILQNLVFPLKHKLNVWQKDKLITTRLTLVLGLIFCNLGFSDHTKPPAVTTFPLFRLNIPPDALLQITYLSKQKKLDRPYSYRLKTNQDGPKQPGLNKSKYNII